MSGLTSALVVLIVAAVAIAAAVLYKRNRAQAATESALDPQDLLDTNFTLKHELPYGTGLVYIDGNLWKVRSDGRLLAGQNVRITDINAGTLMIQPNKLTQAALKQAS